MSSEVDCMKRLTLALLVVVVAVIGAGFIFLATWDIPSPSKPVERVIDDGRFPK